MNSKLNTIFVLTILGSLVFPILLEAGEADEKAAITASTSWLALVDRGKYSESWDQAADFFKNAVKKDQWQASLKGFRDPLGKVVARKLKSKQYTKTLPGAPDGEYVMIQYETSFEKKKSAIETITPMLDKDGKWRVSGYYIK